MVVDGKTLPGSNISVLVNDITRKAKHELDPVGSLSSNNLVKLNFLAVSSEMLKSRESWVKGNVNLLLRVNLRLKYRGSSGKMTDRYYNPGQPGSFGGSSIAERYLKGNVKDFLIRQDAYTLDRPIRHRFRRRQIFTKGIDDLWQANLVDMQSLVLHNDGEKYLLNLYRHVFKVFLSSSIEEQVWTLR